MLQLSRTTTVAALDPSEEVAMQAQFASRHWIKLPGFLAPRLLDYVQQQLTRATFVERVHAGVTPPSVDLSMEPNAAAGLLELVCNDPVFLATIERLTGAAPLTRFGGFVYRLTPASRHAHQWHNDLVEGRRVAMSINLGAEGYEGGVLQLRDRATERVIDGVQNAGPGDAVLFRIDAALQHRALPVTAGVKTAFAGWFFDGAGYHDMLRASVS